MWLEIDNNIIIGIHSDECDNDHLWVEYKGDDANLGDRWQDGAVIAHQEPVDELHGKRRAARAHITQFYPEWKQLNRLREDDEQAM